MPLNNIVLVVTTIGFSAVMVAESFLNLPLNIQLNTSTFFGVILGLLNLMPQYDDAGQYQSLG